MDNVMFIITFITICANVVLDWMSDLHTTIQNLQFQLQFLFGLWKILQMNPWMLAFFLLFKMATVGLKMLKEGTTTKYSIPTAM